MSNSWCWFTLGKNPQDQTFRTYFHNWNNDVNDGADGNCPWHLRMRNTNCFRKIHSPHKKAMWSRKGLVRALINTLLGPNSWSPWSHPSGPVQWRGVVIGSREFLHPVAQPTPEYITHWNSQKQIFSLFKFDQKSSWNVFDIEHLGKTLAKFLGRKGGGVPSECITLVILTKYMGFSGAPSEKGNRAWWDISLANFGRRVGVMITFMMTWIWQLWSHDRWSS